mgnify:CR=1 FL=1
MKLLGRRVLIEEVKHADKIGSLYVPDRAKQRPQEGRVTGIGSEVSTVKVGERVLYGRFAGLTITLDEKAYRVLWDRDVIAVLED